MRFACGTNRGSIILASTAPRFLHRLLPGVGGEAGRREGGSDGRPGRGNSFTLPLRAGETGGLGLQTRIMTSRSRKFDLQHFCRAHGLTQEEFARLTGTSATTADCGGAKAHKAEVIRLIKTLGSLMAPEKLGFWIRKPNKGLKSLTPFEVIEQGKTDRLWRMIYEIRSGQPD